jgi:hypothetical protein
VANKWLDTLKDEELSKHNTAAALRVRAKTGAVGPVKNLKTPECRTDKTDRITNRRKAAGKNPETPKTSTDKTDKNIEAERLGLVATWSMVFGYVSIHDPTTGEWYDVPTKEAPDWAKREAFKRKELYKDGNRRAYRLTSHEMEEILEAERVPEPEGIIEEHPIEEERE